MLGLQMGLGSWPRLLQVKERAYLTGVPDQCLAGEHYNLIGVPEKPLERQGLTK